MNDSVQSAPATLADVKGAIASLESDAQTTAKSLEVKLFSSAKTFYEKHVPLFMAIGGAAAGALAMLIKLKL